MTIEVKVSETNRLSYWLDGKRSSRKAIEAEITSGRAFNETIYATRHAASFFEKQLVRWCFADRLHIFYTDEFNAVMDEITTTEDALDIAIDAEIALAEVEATTEPTWKKDLAAQAGITLEDLNARMKAEVKDAMAEIRAATFKMNLNSLKKQMADTVKEIASRIRHINYNVWDYLRGNPNNDVSEDGLNNSAESLVEDLNKLADLKAQLANLAPYEVYDTNAAINAEIQAQKDAIQKDATEILANNERYEILSTPLTTQDALEVAVNAEIQNANTAKINDLKWEIRYTEGSINDLDKNHIAHFPNDQSLQERRAELLNEIAALKAQLAEIERANTPEVDPIITDRNHNLIADHITGIKEEQPMTDKLIISTKENADGKITAYYINGKKARKTEIEYCYTNNPAYDGIIQTDYYTAKYQFPNLYYGHGCRYFIMTIDEETLMSKAAADLLGYQIGRPFAKGIYRVTKLDQTIPDDDGSNDVEQIAIKDQANFLADKIKRDAQPSDDNEFSVVTPVDDDDDELIDPPEVELAEPSLNYRIESLSHYYGHGEPEEWQLFIEYTDDRDAAMHFSAWASMFLPHFGLVINNLTGVIEYEFGSTNPSWIKWALDSYFNSLPDDIDNSTPNEIPAEEIDEVERGSNLLASLNIPDDIFATLGIDPNADNFINARYLTSVSFRHAEQKASKPIMVISIRSTDFNRADKALAILKNSLAGLPIVYEEEPHIVLMPTVSGGEQIPVYYAPELDGSEEDDDCDNHFVSIPKPDDDNDDDELVDPPVDSTIKIADDLLIYRDGRLAEVESLKYGAWIEFHTDGVHYFTKPVALNGYGFDCDADRWDFDDFISILAQRGAVNEFVSTPKETFQDKLAKLKATYDAAKAIFDEKQARLAEAKEAASQACDVYEDSKRAIERFYQEQRDALTVKLDSVSHNTKIRIMHNNEFFCSSPALNLTVSGGSDNTNYQFSFINWHDIFKPCATYDTPEQVVKVIGLLKEAIQRGDNEFTFPPVDELNFTANENEISSEEVNQTPPDIGDSLIRAMETALKRIQDICRAKPTNLTSINREWQCYLICRRAIGGITNVSAD